MHGRRRKLLDSDDDLDFFVHSGPSSMLLYH